MARPISFCLKAATDLDAQDLEALTAGIEAYRKDGVGDRESEAAAVGDLEAEVEREKADLKRLVREQVPEVFVKAREEPRAVALEVAESMPFAPFDEVRAAVIAAVKERAGKAEFGGTFLSDELSELIHEGRKRGVAKFGEGMPEPVVASQINTALAMRSHAGTSHSPERRGRTEIADYIGAMVAAWRSIEQKYTGADEDTQQRVREEFAALRDGYASRVNAYLAAHANVMSTMIAGPAKFPTSANQKRSQSADNRSADAREFLERGTKRLHKSFDGPADNSLQSERARVESLIASKTALQERMKAANSAVRKGDDAALRELGYDDAQIAAMKKPDFAGRVGFADYQLTNNRAEVKRMEARLKDIDGRLAAAETAQEEEGEAQSDSAARIEQDAEANRVRIVFPGKPDAQTIAALKAAAFKWAPSVGAWQRQLTGNAVAAAERIVGTLKPLRAAAPAAQYDLAYPLAPPGERYEETNKPVTMMSPDEFLEQVRPLEIDEASRDNIEDLKRHIREGKQLDPLHIRADGKEDGRHRAVAAKELGIAEVPVIDERRLSAPQERYTSTREQDPEARGTAEGERAPVAPVRGAASAVRNPRITALGISPLERLDTAGSTALVGATVSGPGDLAALAQIHRDPQVETFRVFFTRGGAIVHATAISSRMPGQVPMVPADMTQAAYIRWFKDQMRPQDQGGTGADGYYILHNHPDGDPTPSGADVSMTNTLSRLVPGMQAHVVINSNQYAVIAPDREAGVRRNVEVVDRDFGSDELLKAMVPSPLLGRHVVNPYQVADLGKSLQKPGWLSIIGAGSDLKTRALAEIPTSALSRPPLVLAAMIRRFQRLTGSANVFLAGLEPGSAAAQTATEGIRRGWLTDAVDTQGNGLRKNMLGPLGAGPADTRGRWVVRAPSADEKAAVTDTPAFRKWFGESKAVDAQGKPLVVYHGTPDGEVQFEARDRGIFFTSSQKLAGDYTRQRGVWMSPGKAPALYPAYLSMQNPLLIDAAGKRNDNIPVPWQPWQPKVFGNLPGNAMNVERALAYARENGHDGLIVRNVNDAATARETRVGDVYAVLRPEQIRGVLDQNDLNILRASPAGYDPGQQGGGGKQPPLPGVPTAAPPSPPPAQGNLPLAGGANPNSAWGMPDATRLDSFIYRYQDKKVDLKRAQAAIVAANRAIQDRFDAYLQEELYHGRAAARVEDFAENELRQVLADMQMRGVTQDRLNKFLHARHAEEANDLIASRGGMPDGGSGMPTADAKAFLASLAPAERARLDAVAAKVDALIAGTRQTYVAYGLESQDTINGWASMFQHYVPLQREEHDGGSMGVGQGFSIKGRESKSRTGSAAAVSDILANIALQREKAIVRGEKNRVAVALVGLATMNPNKDLWEVGKVPTTQVLNPKTQQIETRPDPMYKSRPNVLVAKIKDSKGEVHERAIVFNEDSDRAMRMVTALKNLDAQELEGLLAVSAKITRFFASMNTQYNPVFGFVNFTRDIQGALVGLTSTELNGKQAQVLAQAMKFFAEAAASGFRMDGIKDQALWNEMRREGGTTGWRDLYRTTDDRANAIKKELDPHYWHKEGIGRVLTLGGTAAWPANGVQATTGWLFDWLSDFNESLENVTRLAAYKVALDNGLSKARAASLSKNLTVNFNRGGEMKPQMGALYAFFNAAMQGSARIAQTMFTMEGGDIKTVRMTRAGKAIVAGGVSIGILQALALMAAGFDDDDIPEFVKERNLIIPLGKDKKYIQIPMPLGWHVLPNLGRMATELGLSGGKNAAKKAGHMLGAVVDAFNPFGSSTAAQMVAPTPLDPLVALLENKDWTGRPIARKTYDAAEPGYLNAKEAASKAGRLIAEGINWMSGGTEFKRGTLSPTPDQIDYLIAQVFGGVGRELGKADATVNALRTGEDLPPHKIPLVGRFYGAVNEQSNQASRFYESLTRMREHKKQLDGLEEKGRAAEAAAYERENPEASAVKAAERAAKDISKMRKQKRLLLEGGAPRAEVRDLEKQITERMRAFNDEVKAAQTPPSKRPTPTSTKPTRTAQPAAMTN